MDRFERLLGQWVVARRWWLIVATIAVAFTAASGARFLTVNADTRVFFSEENPQLAALEILEHTYNESNTVFFAVAPQDGDVFTRETLAAIVDLTETAWQIPYSSRVDSLTNFQHTMAEGDDLVVEDLVRLATELSGAEIVRIKAAALSESRLVNSLVSPTGHATGVSVNLLPPGESAAETPEIAGFVHQLAANFRAEHPRIDLYVTGSVMSDQAFAEAFEADMATLMPLMLLTLVVIVGFALRSFVGTLATLVIILLSMITAMGLGGWLGISITSASGNAPIMILILAVADSVHILATIFDQMRRGKAKLDAVAESLRINLQPVFLTTATTAIGFATMNFSDAPPFRDLGNIVAMGVMAAFVYSILLLPALVAVLPIRSKARRKPRLDPLEGFANFVIRRRRSLFWGVLTAILVLTAGTTRLELNDQFMKYFSERFEIRRASDYVDTELSGGDVIEYSLEAGGPGGIHDPSYLETVEAFASWYRQQPKVVHVSALTETVKKLNQDMHGGDESYYRIPQERGLAAQYLLLYEMSLPFGLDLNDRINVDRSATRMAVTLRGTNTNELREMDDKAREWLDSNAPESMFTYGSGLSIIWAHISERNINSMLGASIGALFLISAILMLALRSVKLGLLSLIPNLMPAIMAFGVWGMTVGRVGLGLSVIAGMTIGIVVDDTVHFMSKYLRARREHRLSPAGAVRFSFRTVGTAMWVTTLALVAGFGVLALSAYKMNSDMGLMAALTIALALALDFLFLPTLLMKVEANSHETSTHEPVADSVPVPARGRERAA
jgi:predicted RND superfamily exporter protein